MADISIRLIMKNKTFGNSYMATDHKTKKEFAVDQYPKRDRGIGSANYAVSHRYGGFLGKAMTLRGIKAIILEQRKLKDVV
jgi:hypothetical protein